MKIKIKDKIIFETFYHHILELDIKEFKTMDDELSMVEINKDNLKEAGNAVGHTTTNWIINDYKYVKGFFFLNETGENIGSIWIMFKGGDEKLYKVRKHDSLLFRLEVGEQYRGRGYSKKIMNNTIKYLQQNSISNTCYDCSPKNKIVLKLHNGLGAKMIGKRFFVRIFNKNIPYYTL